MDKSLDVRCDKSKGEAITARDRDDMLKLSETDWESQAGAYRYFNHCVSTDMVERLDEAGLIDNDFGNSPTIAELLEVGRRHSQASYGGHMISPLRDDCRITIDRITTHGDLTDDLEEAFRSLAKTADEVTIEHNHLEAWWD